MRFAVFGLNHRTASVALREKFALSYDEVPQVAEAIQEPDGTEILVLSTCNRVEFYFASDDTDKAVENAKTYLSQHAQVERPLIEDHTYTKVGSDAVNHLFRVASSLDSMVVGEPQILGQLKSAVQHARNGKLIGKWLDRLTSKAFSTAKKVRTRTGIGNQPVSISSVAVDLARQIFGRFLGRKVLLIGAGEMAELAAEQFRNTGAELIIANRGRERADRLASRMGGVSRTLGELPELLTTVDVVVASAYSSKYLVTKAQMEGAMKRRKYRPIFFLDIAVPRNLDPSMNDIDGVYVYDLDSLSHIGQENLRKREEQVGLAESFVDEAVEQFEKVFLGESVTPMIVEIRRRVNALVDAELKHLRVDDQQTQFEAKEIEKVLGRVTNKILHGVSEELRRSAGTPNQEQTIETMDRAFRLPAKGEDS